MHQPRHADDAWLGILLRRTRRTQECAGHHDPEFCLHGMDDSNLVSVRLFAVFQRRLARHHRQSSQLLPARNLAQHTVSQRNHSGNGFHCLSNDVRHHHPGAHLRRIHQSRHLQGLHAVPDRVADVCIFPVRAHGVGRRNTSTVGRAGLCRRHRGAQHRR